MRLSQKEKWIVGGIIGITLSFVFISYSTAAKINKILPSPIPGAEYVGQETCTMCHEKEAKEFERSTHSKFAVSEDEPLGQGCETCHGPGSKHVEAGGGKGVFIVNAGKDPQACFECHLDKKAEFNLQYHHPVLEGRVSCNDCHEAHAEEVRPWTATTLEGPNETCFKCHPDKKGPFVWEHDAVREGCTVCHNVHGSINEKLLVAGDTNLCLKCHYEQAYPTIGDRDHTSYVASARGKKSCLGHHEAVHGSNFGRNFIQP